MVLLSLGLSPLSFHPLLPLPQRSSSLKAEFSVRISSSLPSHRPRFCRKNHLRPKIPLLPHYPSPVSPPSSPSHEPIESSFFSTDSSLLLTEEMKTAHQTFCSADFSDEFAPNVSQKLFPSWLLLPAFSLTAIIAIQTAVSVWFLPTVDDKEAGSGSNDDRYKELMGTQKGAEVEKFERIVAEIREMAREVREREARGKADGARALEKVGNAVDIKKKSIAKVLVNGQKDALVEKKEARILKSKNAGVECIQGVIEGLDCGVDSKKKSVAKVLIDGHGGGSTEKIGKRMHKLKSKGVGYLPKAKGFGFSKPITSATDLDSGKLSVHRKRQRCPGKTSRDKGRKRAPEKLPDCDSVSAETKIQELKGANFSVKSAKDSQVVFPFRESSDSENARTQSSLQYKEARNKDENQWWLKLPYVFGIFLHRSSKSSGCLYSLRMKSSVDGKNQQSHVVTFEDQGDAMNFSYLLESFFEDSDDVGADIVPITMKELNEAIMSEERKFIVVRKGEVRLYAGQPLIEAETRLRSLFG